MKMEYPVFIMTDKRSIQCKGEFDSAVPPSRAVKMQDGKGYLDLRDDHFWIYNHVKPRDPNELPNFWIDGGQFKKSNPPKEVMDKFARVRAINIGISTILEMAEQSSSRPIYNDQVIADLNASSEIFHPVLYTNDDFLKKIIKSVFNSLNVSLAKLKSKAQQKYMISNMKSAVLTSTKMSVKYFNAWAELLGLQITIIVETVDNAEDKLPEPLVYLGNKDAVVLMSECVLDENNIPRFKQEEYTDQ